MQPGPLDLNADLAEGFGVWRLGDDEALLEIITSANVACGFHAGDPLTMRRVCERAVERGVAIGAQVAYRDLAGFGRRRMDVAPDDLAADVLYQLGALHACAVAAGGRVAYVKPHGALYNTAADDADQAAAIVAAMAAFDSTLTLLALPSSAMESAAREAGIAFVAEAFADRAYTSAARLVPRTTPGAMVTDAPEVVARSVRLATEQTVTSIDDAVVPVVARSLCVHGDTPGAVALARAVRAGLESAGVAVAAF